MGVDAISSSLARTSYPQCQQQRMPHGCVRSKLQHTAAALCQLRSHYPHSFISGRGEPAVLRKGFCRHKKKQEAWLSITQCSADAADVGLLESVQGPWVTATEQAGASSTRDKASLSLPRIVLTPRSAHSTAHISPPGRTRQQHNGGEDVERGQGVCESPHGIGSQCARGPWSGNGPPAVSAARRCWLPRPAATIKQFDNWAGVYCFSTAQSFAPRACARWSTHELTSSWSMSVCEGKRETWKLLLSPPSA